MSTKKSHQRTKLLNLENAVLDLESSGMNEQDIFSLVNMVLRGFIREGNVTEEYVQLANQAIEHRRAAAENCIILDTKGNQLGS